MTVLETKQVPDGRGGRRLELTLDDQNAGAMARPGSSTQRTLKNVYGARPRITKR
ncbi:hypothetical protein ACVWZL_003315 [Bradyrhizobium sp. GM2.4]